MGRLTSEGALAAAGKVGDFFFFRRRWFFLFERAWPARPPLVVFFSSLSPSLSPPRCALHSHLAFHNPSSYARSEIKNETTTAGKQQRARWHPAVDRRMLVAGNGGAVVAGNGGGAAVAGRFGIGMLPPPPPPHSFGNGGAAPPLYGGGPSHHSDAPPRLDDINTIWLDAGEGER